MLGMQYFCMIQHRPLEEGVYLLVIPKYFKIQSIYLQFTITKLQSTFFLDTRYIQYSFYDCTGHLKSFDRAFYAWSYKYVSMMY